MFTPAIRAMEFILPAPRDVAWQLTSHLVALLRKCSGTTSAWCAAVTTGVSEDARHMHPEGRCQALLGQGPAGFPAIYDPARCAKRCRGSHRAGRTKALPDSGIAAAVAHGG